MQKRTESKSTDGESRVAVDEGTKSYTTILERELEEGLVEFSRPSSGILLSALSAGLDIGFGPFLMAVVLSMPMAGLSAPMRELFLAGAYSLGFVFVILGRSDLFTEHTTIAVVPVLDGRASLTELARLWLLIYAGNLLGGTVFAAITVVFAPGTNVVDPTVLDELAATMTKYTWWATLLGALLAGWLMGLLSWLVNSATDAISATVFVLLVTASIGFAHLPHSIAGTIEILFGVFAGTVPPVALVEFLVWSTLGNAIGGAVFVGFLKYSHVVRHGQQSWNVEV